MASVNKVILVGNVGNDPESRYAPSGSMIVNISLATTDTWRDKQTGNKQEKTEWHRVTFFNKLAEIVSQYVRKGSPLYIEGNLRYGSYEKDGITRYTTDIIANQMQMLGTKSGVADGASYQKEQPPQPQQNHQPPGNAPSFDDDDDVPF